jgi:hypothetical protein
MNSESFFDNAGHFKLIEALSSNICGTEEPNRYATAKC